METEKEFFGTIISVFPKGSHIELDVLPDEELSDEEEIETLRLYIPKKDSNIVRGLTISGYYSPSCFNKITRYYLA